MLKIGKKILCTLLVVIMCLTSMPLGGFVGLEILNPFSGLLAYAEEALQRNVTELEVETKDITWTFNEETGELRISGTGEMENYSDAINDLSNIDSYIPWFSYRNEITSIVVGEGITYIGDCAFAFLFNVQSISLPSTLVSIGDMAFAYMFDLNYIAIPEGVKEIGDYAFLMLGCESVTIPSTLEIIGKNCFVGASLANITNNSKNIITISNNNGFCEDYAIHKIYFTYEEVMTICEVENAFGYSNTAEDVLNLFNERLNKKGLDTFDSIDSVNEWFDDYSETFNLEYYPDWFVISCYSDSAEHESVKKRHIKHTIIDNENTECECFENSGTFEGLNWGVDKDARVMTVGGAGTLDNTVTDCPWIYLKKYYDSVVIEDDASITAVEIENFGQIDKLTVNANITSITNNYWYWPEFVVAEDNSAYTVINGVLYNKDCTKLIAYPQKLEGEEYIILNTVTEINENAFQYSKQLKTLSYTNGSLLSNIGSYVFSQSSIEVINLPATISNISSEAFANTSLLKEINIADTNAVYSSEAGVLFNKDKSELIKYPCEKNGSSYEIPDSVISITSGAFENNTHIENIYFTEDSKVEEIGMCSFYNCTSLKEIDIPESVTAVRGQAFCECIALNKIAINNPDCYIEDAEDTIYPETVIYGYYDSTAYAYAEKYGRSFVAMACSHINLVEYDEKPATCDEPGLSAGEYCNDCQTWTQPREVLTVLGHELDAEWTVETEKTCIEDGLKIKNCSRCDYKETEVIPAGHIISDEYTEVPATCIRDGYKIRLCTICSLPEGFWAGIDEADFVESRQPTAEEEALFTFSMFTPENGEHRTYKIEVEGAEKIRFKINTVGKAFRIRIIDSKGLIVTERSCLMTGSDIVDEIFEVEGDKVTIEYLYYNKLSGIIDYNYNNQITISEIEAYLSDGEKIKTEDAKGHSYVNVPTKFPQECDSYVSTYDKVCVYCGVGNTVPVAPGQVSKYHLEFNVTSKTGNFTEIIFRVIYFDNNGELKYMEIPEANNYFTEVGTKYYDFELEGVIVGIYQYYTLALFKKLEFEIQFYASDGNGNYRYIDRYTLNASGTMAAKSYSTQTAHKWDDGKVITPATCTSEGSKSYTCGCGETKTETIPKTEHPYVDTVTEPNCINQGYTTYVCSACSDSYVDSYVEALGHDYQPEYIDKTDSMEAHMLYVCSRCDNSYIVLYPASKVQSFIAFGAKFCNELSWLKAVEYTVTDYNVYRSEDKEGEFALIATVNGRDKTSYIDYDVEVGKEYYYKVSACKGEIIGEMSDVSSAVPQPDTKVPEIDKFVSQDKTINSTVSKVVNFEVSVSDDTAVDRYELYYTPADSEDWIMADNKSASSGIARVDTSDFTDGKYSFKLVAYDTSGNENSSILTYNVDNTAPNKVTGLKTIEVFASKATLTWNDVNSGDRYCFILRCKTDDRYYIVDDNIKDVRGYYLKNLEPGTEYTYSVAAVDFYGNIGEYSDDFTFTTTTDVNAPVVTKLSPDPFVYKDVIPFSVTAEDDCGISKITIQTSLDSLLWSDISSCDFSGSKKVEKYSYNIDVSSYDEGSIYVRAYAEDIAGNISDISINAGYIEYLVDKEAPAIPENIKAESYNGYIEISWEQSADADVFAYNLYRSSSADGDYIKLTSNLKNLNYFDRNVSSGSTYYYKITVEDIAGNISGYSDYIVGKAYIDNQKPAIISISSGNNYVISPSKNKIGILAEDNSKLNSLVVEYKTASMSTYETLSSSSDISDFYKLSYVYLPVNSVADGDKIYIRAYCEDEVGLKSDYYEVAYTVDKTAPEIEQLNIDLNDNICNISWKGFGELDVRSYTIYCSIDSGDYRAVANIKPSENTEYAHSITINKTGIYDFRIDSVDSCGNTKSFYTNEIIYSATVEESTVVNISAAINGPGYMEVGVQEKFSAEKSVSDFAIASYNWSFGDGTTSSAVSPVKVYNAVGTYKVTLDITDVLGNVSKTTMTVVVKKRETLGLAKVKVVNENDVPIPGIDVLFDYSSTDQTILTTNANGIATMKLPVGTHKVVAYSDNYLPDYSGVSVLAGETTEVTLKVKQGCIISGDFVVREMNLDEIRAAGIDVSDPENQVQYEVTFTFLYGKKAYKGSYVRPEIDDDDTKDPKIYEIKIDDDQCGCDENCVCGGGDNCNCEDECDCNDDYACVGGCDENCKCRDEVKPKPPKKCGCDENCICGGSDNCNCSNSCDCKNGYSCEDGCDEDCKCVKKERDPLPPKFYGWTDNGKDYVAAVEIPVSVSYLKQFFSATLTIQNNASGAFSLTDCKATVSGAGSGLTLIKSSPISNTICGGSSSSATWIYRGDSEGTYNLSANFTSELDNSGIPVTLSFKGSPIHVYGPDSVKVRVEVSDTIVDGNIYFNIGMVNKRSSNINLPEVNIGAYAMNVLKEFNKTIKEKEKLEVAFKIVTLRTRHVAANGISKIYGAETSIDVLKPGESFYHEYVIMGVTDTDVTGYLRKATADCDSYFASSIEIGTIGEEIAIIEPYEYIEEHLKFATSANYYFMQDFNYASDVGEVADNGISEDIAKALNFDFLTDYQAIVLSEFVLAQSTFDRLERFVQNEYINKGKMCVTNIVSAIVPFIKSNEELLKDWGSPGNLEKEVIDKFLPLVNGGNYSSGDYKLLEKTFASLDEKTLKSVYDKYDFACKFLDFNSLAISALNNILQIIEFEAAYRAYSNMGEAFKEVFSTMQDGVDSGLMKAAMQHYINVDINVATYAVEIAAMVKRGVGAFVLENMGDVLKKMVVTAAKNVLSGILQTFVNADFMKPEQAASILKSLSVGVTIVNILNDLLGEDQKVIQYLSFLSVNGDLAEGAEYALRTSRDEFLDKQDLESAQKFDAAFTAYKTIQLNACTKVVELGKCKANAGYTRIAAKFLNHDRFEDEIAENMVLMSRFSSIYCHNPFYKIKESENGTVKALAVACPVEVYVYSETDELLAKVTDSECVINDEQIAAYTIEGKKFVAIPSSDDYRISIVANDEGTMDYTVYEYDSENINTRRVVFDDIVLEKNDVFNGNINPELNTDAENYTLIKNDVEKISADKDLAIQVESIAFEKECYTVNVGDEVKANVIFNPADSENTNFEWRLTEDNNLIVDEMNNVIANSAGVVLLGAVSEDGGYICWCEVQILCEQHSFGDWEIDKVDTCTESGEKHRVCEVCEYVETVDIPSGHILSGEWKVVKAANCSEDGEERLNCKRCNYFESKVIVSSGHSYATVIKAPTCTEDGYTTYTCSACGDNYTADYKDALKHIGGTANCKDKAVCTRCDTAYGEFDSSNHKNIVTDKAVEATCKAPGLTEGSHCEACGVVIKAQSEIAQLKHDYKPVVTEPTCTEDGYTTYTCSACGDNYTADYKDALKHTGGTANCKDKAVCTRCNTAYGNLDKNNHKNIVTDKAVSASCSATGLAEGSHCDACGKVIKAQSTIAKLPHKEVAIPGKAATCKETGLTEGKKCSVCGEITVAQTTIKKLDHNYVDGTCSKCGDSKTANCSHMCHKNNFIWKILRFFFKLFKIQPVCECGVKHY